MRKDLNLKHLFMILTNFCISKKGDENGKIRSSVHSFLN